MASALFVAQVCLRGGGRGLLKRDWEVGDSDQRRQVFFVLMEGFPIK